MSTMFKWKGLFVLIFVLGYSRAFAASMVFFDFDALQSPSKKGIAAPAIEAYMEELFGSDVSVSQNTTAVGSRFLRSLNSRHSLSSTLSVGNSYLTTGKGKGSPSITLDFGDNPIDSFSIDFQLFRKTKNFSIVADGEVIDQRSLSKSQRKTGLRGQTILFFDEPVEVLQFVSSKKKSIGIDNLAINLPHDLAGGSTTNGSSVFLTTSSSGGFTDSGPGVNQLIVAIPEPSALLLFAVGLSLAFLKGSRTFFSEN